MFLRGSLESPSAYSSIRIPDTGQSGPECGESEVSLKARAANAEKSSDDVSGGGPDDSEETAEGDSGRLILGVGPSWFSLYFEFERCPGSSRDQGVQLPSSVQ